MPQKTIPIANGAEAIFVEDSRFSTSLISFNFYLPLDTEKIADFALLPFVLTTCSKNYPDFSRLNYILSKLYGASLTASAEKLGDFQLLKVGISVIDDRFALDNEKISENAVALLFDLLFNPKAENGVFSAEDVEREKKKAIEHIKGEMGDKRLYAKQRLIEEMFKGDPYGSPKCGSISQVEKVTGESLYKAWQEMLSNAFVRVNVISKKTDNALLERIIDSFAKIERKADISKPKSHRYERSDTVNEISEKMDVKQGKLSMGFTTNFSGGDDTAPALAIMCDIFGGGPYSNLFTVVREKMSLCYYCSALSVKVKGIITVSSGIEAQNAQKTKEAILEQLDVVKKGGFTDEQLDSSKKAISGALKTYEDSQNMLDVWYSMKIENEYPYSPTECAEFFSAVTRADVERVARSVTLHTVYTLLPKEEA